jgi:phenylalanyl-tRNA synthetase beta chain
VQIGIAREIAALTGQRLKKPRFELDRPEERVDYPVRVEILDTDLCSRYVARLITGIEVKDSPWWMKRRLQATGIRPISNVVDITNYVMMELGQPLHAFDYHLIEGGHIIVRRAAEGEELVTLDGVRRQLHQEDLLICDPGGPIALAGVMGGQNTEVSAETDSVLLESAHFDHANIMRTSHRHGLSSEASYRFERGVDPGGCLYAADRAAFFMGSLSGDGVRLVGEALDERGRVIEPLRLSLRVERASMLIGVSFNREEIGDLLRSIEIGVVRKSGRDGQALEVRVPTFRPDIEREADLVEEIARLYGYDRIPSTLPETSRNIGGLTRDQRLIRKIAGVMTGLGLYEAISLAFVSPAWLDILDPERTYLPRDVLKLHNPISEDTSVMRPSLLPGMLDVLVFNLNRRILDIAIFEMGRVFTVRRSEKLPREDLRLGCAMTGRRIPKQWEQEEENIDFYTVKGVMEALLKSLNIEDWKIGEKEIPFLNPSKSCSILIGGEEAGYLGLVHPRIVKEVGLSEPTACLEVDVPILLKSCREVAAYREIPRFPSIQLDIAVVVDEAVAAQEVENIIREAGGELLREAKLFDLYRGQQIGRNEKSLAYNLTFYAMDRTLKDGEARVALDGIIGALSERLNARIRQGGP